jgi:hypothetical protein
MKYANAIVGAGRTVAGTEAGKALEKQFQKSRIVAEMNARSALFGPIDGNHDGSL